MARENRADRAAAFAERHSPDDTARLWQFMNAYEIVDKRLGRMKALSMHEESIRDCMEGIVKAAGEAIAGLEDNGKEGAA